MKETPSADEVIALFGPCRRPSLKALMGRMRSSVVSRRFSYNLLSESLIETGLLQAAEICPFILEVASQPLTVEIEDALGELTYTPDALILSASRGWCMVECKPSREYFDKEAQATFARFTEFFAKYNLPFVVIDEHDVAGRTLRSNIYRLRRLMDAKELDAPATLAKDYLEHGGEAKASELIAAGIASFAIDRALFLGWIYADLQRPLGPDTVLRATQFDDHRQLLRKLYTAPSTGGTRRAPPLWEVAQ